MGQRTSFLVLSLMLVGIATFIVGAGHGSTGDAPEVVAQKATAPVEADSTKTV